MAQERSDNSRYESRYGGGFVTPAQYIAEIMCERAAKKDKKDLPVKFWNLPTWKRTFMTQVLAANSVLKLYSPKAIIAALRRAPTVYSLRAHWLDPIMQEEQAKVESYESKMEQAAPVAEVTPAMPVKIEKPRESFSTEKSKLKKLRELDE